jgi:hypothetical protein
MKLTLIANKEIGAAVLVFTFLSIEIKLRQYASTDKIASKK